MDVNSDGEYTKVSGAWKEEKNLIKVVMEPESDGKQIGNFYENG